MNGCADATAFPEGDNLFEWVGTIKGSEGTVYEGLSYKLSLKFPSDYPYSAPTIKFTTACFHPNVDQYGNICLDILKVRGVCLRQSIRIECAVIVLLNCLVPPSHRRSGQRRTVLGRFCFLCRACWEVRNMIHPPPECLSSFPPIFSEPNNDSPLNGTAAALWDNQEEYKRVLLKKYAEATAAQ
jgi:ubiquitin-conjugating enzyme E2 C